MISMILTVGIQDILEIHNNMAFYNLISNYLMRLSKM